jgi:PAS domain S-box-containing protein
MTPRPLTSALLRRFVLAFVLFVSGILLLAGVLEYQGSRQRAQTVLNDLADTFAPGVAAAVWDYQGDLLQATARGIGNHPAVESVTITDQRGKVWAHWQASEAQASELSVTRQLRRAGGMVPGQVLGSLTITSSVQRISAGVLSDLTRQAVMICVLLFLLLYLLWFLIQRLVVRPLSRLSQKVANLSVNDSLQPLELGAVGVLEIASLQHSFVQLMAQVARSHQQIAQHNAELGGRVAERTAQLSDQVAQTEAILEQMVDALITSDTQGSVCSFNSAAELMFGYRAAEVIGHPVKLLMPSPERDEHAVYLREHIGSGHEVVGLRKDGSHFPAELAVTEISRQGQPIYVGMLRDISERRRIEQMKSEFVGTVSHELRTPLTSIAGALGLLAGGVLGELPAPALHMIDVALRNSQLLTLLINDLLDMEKLLAGQMRFDIQPAELAPIILDSIDINRQYDTQGQLHICCTSPLPAVRVAVDKQRLQQALSNFLSNALKFSPPQGVVEVMVEVRSDWVRVSVRDQGSGVPEAFRERIFQKFAQADSTDTRQKGGTGLGLAITRELVERMGGQVGFDSPAGQGATFWLELPLLKA